MFEKNEEMLELIKYQIGSNGEKGWPVAVRDRIAFPKFNELKVTDANVAVTFLWTMRDSVLPLLEKENLAIATNFYTPSGLQGMIRNILGNPFIRYVILIGEEYPSKSEGDKISELTSANAIRAFFERGVNENRKIDGFENAVYFDKNIPLEFIEEIRQNVKLIDLNKTMPYASLNEKIQEANRLIRNLEKQDSFLDKPQTFDYESVEEAFPYEGGSIIVHGNNIPNAWIKMIYNIYRYGRKNLMNANTDRWVKEINNMAVVIHNPQDKDLSVNPFLVPLTIEKIEAYKKEILSSILPEGKAYTYGNELRAYNYPSAMEIKNLVNSTEYKDFEFGQGEWLDKNVNYIGESCEVNQIADIIDVLKRDPYSKACVAITWHPSKELMKKHKSSPCLVLLQAIVQDEKLNLLVFFRSHDMTQGWPENAYGCAAIQEEIAKGIGIESGILTIISGSAQIYNNYYQQVEEMLKNYSGHLKNCNDSRGNYQITIDKEEIILKLLHPKTGIILEEIRGKSAYEIKDKISLHGLETGHAIYIGTELAMAEMAIKTGINYEQDETIGKPFKLEDKDFDRKEPTQDFYISPSRKKPNIYIAGTLTQAVSPEQIKKFYERIAEVVTQQGFEAYLPHKNTDPIQHAHISAREVYEKDYEMISNSDIMICFVGEPSLGVGTELEIAKNNDVKIILIYPEGQKISREALGNPAVAERIIYSSEEEALDKLGPILNIIKKKLNFNIIKESELGSRPTWDEYFMKAAITLSSRSSCLKVHSGSVIVHNKSIVGEGYNGAPPGIKSCLEKGVCTKELKTGQKYEDTLNTGQCIGVHSEMNALAHTNTTIHKGATIYTTILPCHACAKTLISHGIKRVVFKKMYDEEEAKRVIELFKEAEIQIDELDISPKRLIDIDFSYRKLKFDIWSEKEKEKIKEIMDKK